jgi:hypothetical protein
MGCFLLMERPRELTSLGLSYREERAPPKSGQHLKLTTIVEML